MQKTVILYNPLAGNGHGKEEAEQAVSTLSGYSTELVDLTTVDSTDTYLAELPEDVLPVLFGGDGTLNHFINHTDTDHLTRDLYYVPAGTGNDFMNDVKDREKAVPFLLNPYLKDLPVVTVKGQEYRVLNGVGYGIDGYCCEVADQLKEKSTKPINYASIAIKGMLGAYKPTDAEIVVDGVPHTYKKVWLAPTMHGRCYGGGMYATPDQDRMDPARTLSTLVFHGSSRLKCLTIFPGFFKGEHVQHKKQVAIFTGHEVTVRFSSPRALQVDGETILGVSEYTIRS